MMLEWNMSICMKKHKGYYKKGQIYTLTYLEARRLIQDGYATLVAN